MFGERARADGARARLAADAASFALGLSAEEVLEGKRGCAQVAFARQVAMYICHTSFELSLARVAAAFQRDRSTVAHASRAIEDRRDDPSFDRWISDLEAMLRDAPSARSRPAALGSRRG